MSIFGSIYRFVSLATGKIYIGSTAKRFPSDRKQAHLYVLRRNKHTNHHLQNIYNKYGENDLHFEIIGSAYFESQSDLRRTEGRAVKAIPDLLRLNYNLDPDVVHNLGKKASPETKEKLRLSHLGHKPSPETLARQAASRKGHEVSSATRAKIGDSHRGMKHSDDAKQKMSQAKVGKPNWRRKLTYEQAQEIRRFGLNGITISDISRKFGISRKSVRAILNNQTYLSSADNE